MSKTTILIDADVREKLKQYGFKGQTYNDILLSLMEVKKQVPLKEELTA